MSFNHKVFVEGGKKTNYFFILFLFLLYLICGPVYASWLLKPNGVTVRNLFIFFRKKRFHYPGLFRTKKNVSNFMWNKLKPFFENEKIVLCQAKTYLVKRLENTVAWKLTSERDSNLAPHNPFHSNNSFSKKKKGK